MKKRVAIAFTGPSGSGKTTLVEKVANVLLQHNKVAIIKHDPKDKAVFDTEGKDSDKFTKTGAEVIVSSLTRTTFFSQRQKSLSQLVAMVDDFDILLVEGLKTWELPRIAIFRNTIDESYLDCSEAIAIDESVDLTQYTLPSHLTVLDLNNTQEIVAWIHTHAQTL